MVILNRCLQCRCQGLGFETKVQKTCAGNLDWFRKRMAFKLAQELGLRQRLVGVERLARGREPAVV